MTTYRLDVQTTHGRYGPDHVTIDGTIEDARLAAHTEMSLWRGMGIPCWVDIIGPAGIVETVGPPPVVTG